MHRSRTKAREAGARAPTTFLVLMALWVGIVASTEMFAGGPSIVPLAGPRVSVDAAIEVGAPPGYGLTDSSKLEYHGPIYIGSNADFLKPESGVRRGTGSAAEPYIISDWFIDASLYTWAMAMIHIEGTDAYVIIENNKIFNLWHENQWEAIQLGHYPDIVSTSHVRIRHNDIETQHAYGIAVREGSNDVYIDANYVKMDANVNHNFGIQTDRNVHGVTIVGNYVSAYTSQTYLTAGIRISDSHIDDTRRVTGVVVQRNTVVDATAGGIVALSGLGTRIEANLVYTDYPVPKVVGPDYPRGIMTEQNAYGTVVVRNVISSVHWGIEVGADRGWFASNTIADVDYAIYAVDNGTFPGASAFGATIYDTSYDRVASGGIRLPADFQGTVLDLGPGIRPADMTPVTLSILGTATRISYAWSEDLLNLSATVNGVVLFDTILPSEGQALIATWSGSIAALEVTSLLVGRVTFELQATGEVGFSGTGFAPSERYTLNRTDPSGTTTVLSTTSSPNGALAFTIPAASTASTFALEADRAVDPTAPTSLANVSGTPGTNGWYVSSVSVTLSAESPSGSSVTIAYRLEGGVWSTYTGAFTVGEGRHTLEWQATDAQGHREALRSLPLSVDLTNPTITGLSPAGVVTNPDTAVSWSGGDIPSGIARYEVGVDGAAFQRIGAEPGYSQSWSSGPHTVRVKAVDVSGRESVVTTSFTVDVGTFGSGGVVQILPVAFPVLALALLVASFVHMRLRTRERGAPPAGASRREVSRPSIPQAEVEERAAKSDELTPEDFDAFPFRPEDFSPDDRPPEESRYRDSFDRGG